MIKPLERLYHLSVADREARLARAINMLTKEHNQVVHNAVSLGHLGAWILDDQKDPNREETPDERGSD